MLDKLKSAFNEARLLVQGNERIGLDESSENAVRDAFSLIGNEQCLFPCSCFNAVRITNIEKMI